MLEPPLRRKPATELEAKLCAGELPDLDELVQLIDQPLIDELAIVFRGALSREEREDLARDVFVELCETPTKYDATRLNLVSYAQMRVRSRAWDYLRRRKRTRLQQKQFNDCDYLKMVPSYGSGSAESFEHAEAISHAVEKARLAILQLTPAQQDALKAYMLHGRERFAAIHAEEIGVSPNLVSQRFKRARAKLRDAIGPDVPLFD